MQNLKAMYRGKFVGEMSKPEMVEFIDFLLKRINELEELDRLLPLPKPIKPFVIPPSYFAKGGYSGIRSVIAERESTLNPILWIPIGVVILAFALILWHVLEKFYSILT